MSISMIAVDTAKSLFQLHGIDASGTVQLKRNEVNGFETSSFGI